MLRVFWKSTLIIGFGLLSMPVLAANLDRVQVGTSDEYGKHLTDGHGRALYLFEADTQGQSKKAANSACKGDCLAVWPAAETSGKPKAGEGVDASKLATIDRSDGVKQVTYDGWPLYYYVKDEDAEDTYGEGIKGFGAEWYLVSPDGTKIENEEGHAD